jgi:hypothetical protein
MTTTDGHTNHAGTLEPGNVKPTTAPVTRIINDDLDAVAAVTLVMAGLDRPVQRRVAAFVNRKWGSDA